MQKIALVVMMLLSNVGQMAAEQWEHPRNRKEEARMMSKEKKRWVWSAIALTAASVADVSSSWGKVEGNPILRSKDGRFGARGFGIKMGMVGGILFAQHSMASRQPEFCNLLTIGNYTMTAAKTGVAVRNFGVEKPKYLLRDGR